MTPISVDRLHEVWPRVREGLWRIKDRGNEPWTPEDVYCQLRLKTAHLVMIGDDGFLIYQVLVGDDYRGVLHVWCLEGELKQRRAEIFAWLDDLKNKLNVARIRCISPRRWDATGEFRLVGYIYER